MQVPSEDQIELRPYPNELDELEPYDDIPDWGSGLIDYNVLESLRLTGQQNHPSPEEFKNDSFKGSGFESVKTHEKEPPAEIIVAKRKFESKGLSEVEAEKAAAPKMPENRFKTDSQYRDDHEGEVFIESGIESFRTQSRKEKDLKNSFHPEGVMIPVQVKGQQDYIFLILKGIFAN